MIRATRGQRLPESVARRVEDPLFTNPERGQAGSERAGRARDLPPVSVLKPLYKNLGLADNLRASSCKITRTWSWCSACSGPTTPPSGVVQALAARYPQVATKLVIHPGSGAINPKVDNLLGMLPHASHDLLLISDSNVRAPAHYVSEMVETLLADPRNGLVTNLFAGTGENGLGSALENVQLNGFCAAGSALPTLLGDALVIGKSMLFSRQVFEALGGFRHVANILAKEDYVMGKLFQHGGYRVRIAPTVLDNVTCGMTVRGFVQRQQRWAMLRSRLRPAAQLVEPLTSPLALLPLAWWGMGPAAALTWMVVLLALRDVGGWVALRGFRRAWLPALLSPARELFMLLVWARAPLKRHVTWRGHKVRLRTAPGVRAGRSARALTRRDLPRAGRVRSSPP